jgi:hypothetical protein
MPIYRVRVDAGVDPVIEESPAPPWHPSVD